MKSLLILILASLLTACASVGQRPITVAISTLAAPDAKEKKTYILQPTSDAINPNDLQYLEYASIIDRALAAEGFIKSPAGMRPDMVIQLHYDISDPEFTQETYNVPIFGQTGVSSSQTYGTFTGNTYSATTYNNPTYGITGVTSQTRTVQLYTRRMSLQALVLDPKNQNQVIPLWNTAAVSIGNSGDLRYVFPYMVKAAMPYFGINTGRSVFVDVRPWLEDISVIAPSIKK